MVFSDQATLGLAGRVTKQCSPGAFPTGIALAKLAALSALYAKSYSIYISQTVIFFFL